MPENSDLDYIQELRERLGRFLKKLEIGEIHGIIYQGYALDKKKNVVGLNLNSSAIVELEAMVRLKNLTHLDLSDNRIFSIRPLENLKNLTHLFLPGNQISNLEPLKKLEKLEWLDLSHNPIDDYSPLGELPNLTRLSLSFNDLTGTSFLKNLPKLEYLDLSHCNLTDITFLADSKKLSYLDLNGNQISDVSCLTGLEDLTHLDLRNNNIHRLPPRLLNTDMKVSWENHEPGGILLQNNPLPPPPLEIEKKGKHAVNIYLRSLFNERVTINEVKVLLLGDGGAGKTSLVKSVCGEEPDLKEPMTPGINIKPWVTRSREEPVKVNFWDFGGQEIMHTTHQFFLTRRSLYILVLDGRRDEKPDYWLDHIRTFGGSSPVIVVLNKIDQNPQNNVNRKFYKKKYPNIIDFFPLSCTTKEGLSIFIEKLKNALPEVEMFKSVWPVDWIKVKFQLEDLKENYITFEKYREICKNQKIIESEQQDTLLEYLHDLGVMLNFRESNLLGTKVLEPEWVTKGVYKIINSDPVRNQKGILRLESLPQILVTDPDSPFRYPPETRQYFVELMIKFKLGYMVDHDTLLLPDRLEEPEPFFDFASDSAIHFFLKYNFLPRSVLTRFLVTMHNDIKGNLRWRTGVVLYNPSFRSEAVVRADYGEKKIFIDVNGDSKRDYLSVIRYYLRNIKQGYEEIKATEYISFPEEPNVSVSYEHLRYLFKIGQKDYIPDGSRKSYNVIGLLEGIENHTGHRSEIDNRTGELPPSSNSPDIRRLLVLTKILELHADNAYQPQAKIKIREIL
jgi:internalin A